MHAFVKTTLKFDPKMTYLDRDIFSENDFSGTTED